MCVWCVPWYSGLKSKRMLKVTERLKVASSFRLKDQVRMSHTAETVRACGHVAIASPVSGGSCGALTAIGADRRFAAAHYSVSSWGKA